MNPFDLDDVDFDPDAFSGVVRLFPIPNLVMFPHVVQPLHVFEERYREMTEDALADDSLLAMPVLKPGWESEYAGRPPVEKWACLGKVVLHNRLPDGCYNLLLMGVSRLRLNRELQPVRSFRQATAEIVGDILPEEQQSAALREELIDAYNGQLSGGNDSRDMKKLLESGLSLGQLTNLLSYVVPQGVPDKLTLLSQPSVIARAEHLLRLLGSGSGGFTPSPAAACDFPPPFSAN